jgi:phosphate transport system substrate-binding protein
MRRITALAVLAFGPAWAGIAQEQLTGAGATFPAPIYQKWMAAFQERHPGPAITYEATGSEEGIRRLKEGLADFAASDVLPSAADEKELAIEMLPAVVGAVVPVYNVPGLRQDLRFSAEVLAGIYLGRIQKWNDTWIKALNRETRLPAADIVVVHRSDGSGTTFVLSDFLSKTCADWKSAMGAGSTLKWPAGESAKGNEGVAAKVASTKYSIGYVEFIYGIRQHLSYGAVENAEGKFVRADIDSLSAAAATGQDSGDFRISITNAPGKNAYPIASFTWFLTPKNFKAPAKRKRMAEFLDWALSSGQRQAAALGYVALPEELATREREVVRRSYSAPYLAPQ